MSQPQASPAPTYISTCEAKDWPLGSHPKHISSIPTSPLAIKLDTKADYDDPFHPHHPTHVCTPRVASHIPSHRRHGYLPWLLATFFLLTTLFLASIVLGVRFFDLTHPVAPSPQIHVLVDGRRLEDRGSDLEELGRVWSIVTPGVSTGSLYTTTRTKQGLSISTAIVSGAESRTGRLHTAPTDAPEVADGENIEKRDGFITLVK